MVTLLARAAIAVLPTFHVTRVVLAKRLTGTCSFAGIGRYPVLVEAIKVSKTRRIAVGMTAARRAGSRLVTPVNG